MFLKREFNAKEADMYFFSSNAKKLKRWLQYKDRYKQCEYIFCTTKATNLKVGNYETNCKQY